MNNYLENFKKVFGYAENTHTYFAPGRVNLIGEHTDYNGGYVFPCALSVGTHMVVAKRNDSLLRFYSENFTANGIIECDLSSIKYDEKYNWANYPLGVIHTFIEKGYKLECGLDIWVYGNIPNGSGLSSSASIEVVTATMLKDILSLDDMTPIDISLLCQYSENNFNGMECGIMDQFAIAMGKKNHGIILDTSTLEYEYAPLNLDGIKIVVISSNKKRKLCDSKYNERRAECEKALEIINTVTKVNHLCDLSVDDFVKYGTVLTDDVLYRRAKHAVTENHRTQMALEALKDGNLRTFGHLMVASHMSLKNDYEVTGIELDTLVDAALKQCGVIGARMTGAGFGGCTVNLVREENLYEFIDNVGNEYLATIGYSADFYVVDAGDGAKVLN